MNNNYSQNWLALPTTTLLRSCTMHSSISRKQFKIHYIRIWRKLTYCFEFLTKLKSVNVVSFWFWKNIWIQQKNVRRPYETFSVFNLTFNFNYDLKKFIFSSFLTQFTTIYYDLIFTKCSVRSIVNFLSNSNFFQNKN